MSRESGGADIERLREIEAEITEGLALLGRWSHLYEALPEDAKRAWKTVTTGVQGSGDRESVRAELDAFITSTLRPAVERLG